MTNPGADLMVRPGFVVVGAAVRSGPRYSLAAGTSSGPALACGK